MWLGQHWLPLPSTLLFPCSTPCTPVTVVCWLSYCPGISFLWAFAQIVLDLGHWPLDPRALGVFFESLQATTGWSHPTVRQLSHATAQLFGSTYSDFPHGHCEGGAGIAHQLLVQFVRTTVCPAVLLHYCVFHCIPLIILWTWGKPEMKELNLARGSINLKIQPNWNENEVIRHAESNVSELQSEACCSCLVTVCPCVEEENRGREHAKKMQMIYIKVCINKWGLIWFWCFFFKFFWEHP